jgi:riboflavin synthase
MFTGIVQTIGTVRAINALGGDAQFVIEAPGLDLMHARLGDSIAVNGCCLTVTRLQDSSFTVDVSRESLDVTTLGAWIAGTRVNLEAALRAGDALGGHYVTGHVDGVGLVVNVAADARSTRVEFEVGKQLGRYIAKKGSVCIDGVSLTVNGVNDADERTRFDVNLVPHTLSVTILQGYRPGTRVNVEIDVIARYVERISTAS